MFTHVNSMFLIKMNNLPSSWNVTNQFHVQGNLRFPLRPPPLYARLFVCIVCHRQRSERIWEGVVGGSSPTTYVNRLFTYVNRLFTYVNCLFTYVNRLFTYVNSLFLIKMNNLPSSWNVTKQFHVYPRQYIFWHFWLTLQTTLRISERTK